ncbi:hypothetical protein DOY81_013588, partial [Sarcophaga bullata]
IDSNSKKSCQGCELPSDDIPDSTSNSRGHNNNTPSATNNNASAGMTPNSTLESGISSNLMGSTTVSGSNMVSADSSVASSGSLDDDIIEECPINKVKKKDEQHIKKEAVVSTSSTKISSQFSGYDSAISLGLGSGYRRDSDTSSQHSQATVNISGTAGNQQIQQPLYNHHSGESIPYNAYNHHSHHGGNYVGPPQQQIPGEFDVGYYDPKGQGPNSVYYEQINFQQQQQQMPAEFHHHHQHQQQQQQHSMPHINSATATALGIHMEAAPPPPPPSLPATQNNQIQQPFYNHHHHHHHHHHGVEQQYNPHNQHGHFTHHQLHQQPLGVDEDDCYHSKNVIVWHSSMFSKANA